MRTGNGLGAGPVWAENWRFYSAEPLGHERKGGAGAGFVSLARQILEEAGRTARV